MTNQIALRGRLSEIINEYDTKKSALESETEAFEAAGVRVNAAACVMGVYGQHQIDTGHVYLETLERSLLKSAWLALYDRLELNTLMSADDKKRFEQGLSHPAEFTLDNIKATFGDFIIDPYGNILRGLAEVFCGLDQAYKSHDKVKIGVEGLPKRIILGGFGGWSGYGSGRVGDILNALASYQGKEFPSHLELREFVDKAKKQGSADLDGRGVTLKVFKNGNGHLSFDAPTLRDINKALADFYGDVLADCHEEKPTEKAASTAVSKDLQYYPTPVEVVEIVLRDVWIKPGHKVLEPSCGCGRFLDGIKKVEKKAKVTGIEVDPARANEARAKGHSVLLGNFLESVPEPVFDLVIMNPPFYGTHYEKHVRHALKFLKPGGTLKAILPITAQTDHGLLDDVAPPHGWRDLPVGSFRESGTNINTTVLTITNRE